MMKWPSLAALAIVVAGTGPQTAMAQGSRKDEATVSRVLAEKLPNVPGKTMTAVLVEYGPGGSSKSHVHPGGSVMAYVLSGAIRSKLDDGPVMVYRVGQSWFEPPGTHHVVSENASASEPASLLAVFVADDSAPLTVFDK